MEGRRVKDDLPDVHFGEIKSQPADWRKGGAGGGADDDADLSETPPDVVEMLGFDPKSEAEEK